MESRLKLIGSKEEFLERTIEENVRLHIIWLSYLKMDDTEPNSQKYTYSNCRFKTGKKNPKNFLVTKLMKNVKG